MSDQLMARIEALLSLNESLLKEAYRKREENGWKTDAFGLDAINNDADYANYKRKKYFEIVGYRTVTVNEAKMNGLIDIRCKRINRAFDHIGDEGNFGTILNIAYLLYENLERDLDRNRIKDDKCSTLVLQSEKERNALSLALIDSITNSTTLMDGERELLTRLYHRMKGDEGLLEEEA